MNIVVEYNIKGVGPKITVNGDKDQKFLINYLVNHKDINYTSDVFTLSSNCWYLVNRSFHTKWEIEVWEARGDKTYKIFTDKFIPDYKPTHVYLDSSKSFETHQNWMKAVVLYQKTYETPLKVETPYVKEFTSLYPDIEFVSTIIDEGNCYVNYVISDFNNPPKTNLIPYIYNQREIFLDSYQYPKCYSQVDEYEFARAILFGVDLDDPYYLPIIPLDKGEEILRLLIQE